MAVGVGAAGAVVPGAAIPEREASGVELGATRGAHRHTEVGTVEDEGLPGEGKRHKIGHLPRGGEIR